MKLLCISDIHTAGFQIALKLIKNYAKEIDAVVIAGDITDFGKYEDAIKMLEKFSEERSPVLFVPGNCDPVSLLESAEKEKVICIHGKSCVLGDFAVIGVGGSNLTPFSTPIEFEEEKIASILDSAYKAVGREAFILVSHAPAYNTKLDKIRQGIHVGSKAIRKFIEEKRPFLAISGHIHEARGLDKLNDTVLVNPGPVSLGNYCLVDIINTKNVEIELKTVG